MNVPPDLSALSTPAAIHRRSVRSDTPQRAAAARADRVADTGSGMPERVRADSRYDEGRAGPEWADFDQEIVYRMGILDGIRGGYLCDLRAVRVALETDFGDVHARGGDLADGELGDALMAADAPE